MTPAGAAGALVPEPVFVPEPVPPLAPVPAPLPLLAPPPAFAPEAPSTPAAPPAPPPQAVSNSAARNTTPLRDSDARVRAFIVESDLRSKLERDFSLQSSFKLASFTPSFGNP